MPRAPTRAITRMERKLRRRSKELVLLEAPISESTRQTRVSRQACRSKGVLQLDPPLGGKSRGGQALPLHG